MMIDLKKDWYHDIAYFSKLKYKIDLGVIGSFVSLAIHIKMLAYKYIKMNLEIKMIGFYRFSIMQHVCFFGAIVCNQNIDWK